jgi:CheY-like chemotaxis protein
MCSFKQLGTLRMALVLIVDNNAAIRRIMVHILEGARHQTIEAGNGREGLAQFEAERPAVVVTDIVMPEADGFEFIAQIRRSAPETCIIAVSGGGEGGPG